jgi:hypothetical protein
MALDMYYDYKQQLMNDLLTDPEVLRLLSDDMEATGNPGALVYSQVFPFEYVPETVEHGHTFICCDVDITRTYEKPYLQATLYIWVFTHKSKLKLPGGGVRTDKLVSRIDELLNGSRYYGLGELDLHSSKRFAPMTDYQGKMLTYHAIDLNRTYPTGKQVPSKRGS